MRKGNQMTKDEYWMSVALSLAKSAESIDEVPIGAVVVRDGKIISTGFNTRETLNKTNGHAELEAIATANKNLKSWRLVDCELYVTIEPCIMCAATLQQSRIKRVIYGSEDPKGGGVESIYAIGNDARLNHNFDVTKGVMRDECSRLLRDYFRRKRKKKE